MLYKNQSSCATSPCAVVSCAKFTSLKGQVQRSHLYDLLLAVALSHLGGHHGKEVIKVDGARAVLVNICNHLLHLLLLRLKS